MSNPRRLSLKQYRRRVAKCPRPSERQIDDFIDFVCDAHSWYKHLPLLPPGNRFVFFLDSHAGEEMRVGLFGRITFRERLETDPVKFHYTWMTTSDYRERFGSLTYAGGAGKAFRIGASILDDTEARIYGKTGRALALPAELMEAGSAEVTGVVHRHAASSLFAPIWLAHIDRRDIRFPEESGGEATLLAMKKRCQELAAERERRARGEQPTPNPPNHRSEKNRTKEETLDLIGRIDPEIKTLLAPERRRQHLGMRRAIEAMLDLVDARSRP